MRRLSVFIAVMMTIFVACGCLCGCGKPAPVALPEIDDTATDNTTTDNTTTDDNITPTPTPTPEPIPIPTPTPAPNTKMTVYYTDSGRWGKVYAYIWNYAAGTYKVSWPGILLSAVGPAITAKSNTR